MSKNTVLKELEKVQFLFLKLNKLKVLEDNGLDHLFMVENIVNDIESAGKLLSPLSVVGPYNGGMYIVVDGGRRLNALRQMGATSVPCYVVGDSSVSVERATALALNANRSQRAADASQIASYARYISEQSKRGVINPKARESILCNNYGISSRMARKYIALVDHAPEKLMNAVINDGFKVSWGEAIVRGYEDKIRKPDDPTLDMLMDVFYRPEFKHRNKNKIVALIANRKVQFKDGQAVIDEVNLQSQSNIDRARSGVKLVTTSDKLKKSDLKLLMKDFRAMLNAHGISIDEFKAETDNLNDEPLA